MNRRDFIHTLGASGLAVLLPDTFAAVTPDPSTLGAPSMQDLLPTQSRAAYHELIAIMQELDSQYLSPARRIASVTDVSDGHRQLLHHLQLALSIVLEADPERPTFRRTTTPTMKFLGDNPDAIYYTAFIRPDRNYRIRGNIAGADFTSFSLERGGADGHPSKGVTRVIEDHQLAIAADGSYEFHIGPEARGPGGFQLDADTGSIQTRHFFEREQPVAADPNIVIPLLIEPLDAPGPRPAPDDGSIAAGIRHAATFLRETTLGMQMMQPGKVPSWVSLVPNQFNPARIPDDDIGFANRSAAYAMAPYFLAPDQALVIEGRFPRCRFANLMLWNRFLQTYDFETHTISRNRKTTTLLADGRFRMVVAHRDPGVPNWLDTQGRPSGLMYWRFLLPQEAVAPLETRVMKLDEVKALGA
ncbi:MAG: hypothetical protein JSR19_07355 [Proteobacteria bacterium]|nr:hypothetical protein [Pseudomonadota bacterium]HQR04910.1 hypothetical protein [Rhodocyclaceae bacterium]